MEKAPDHPGTRSDSTQRDVAHELLTIKEAAAAMRVSLSLGYQLAHEYLNSGGTHGLPVLRFGAYMRVPRWALDELITTGRVVRLWTPPSVSAVGRSGRPSTVSDLHRLAQAMPHTSVEVGRSGNRIYQVGRKSFVFFRTPRPDAVDPKTGERYDDVVVIWVGSQQDKEALVQDPSSPFFTTPHFDGHPSVLVRSSRIGEVDIDELAEIVQDAWLSQASSRRARDWLASQGIERSS